MGYSCASKARMVLDGMMEILQRNTDEKSSNVWKVNGTMHFYEIGREQRDGAITGVVQKETSRVGETVYCRRVGTIRIEADGTISRWYGSTKAQREEATKLGLVEFNKVFQTKYT